MPNHPSPTTDHDDPPLTAGAVPVPASASDSEADADTVLYTVSVRSLCEFTAKEGDLDRRFTPSATALEGIRGQQTVVDRRGPGYETEVPLERIIDGLRVRGRADGWDPRRHCLEEIKTIRGQHEDIPANRRRLHWAQLQTYGAMFCVARGLPEVTLALVYFDTASQTESELRQVYGAEELDALYRARCAAFRGWARQQAAHRRARDAALSSLAFPQAAFRPGQRDLAEAVFRVTTHRRTLLAQAPTGIGKTVGTLFPVLRAMPAQGLDKLAYLTCKGTGRITALEALGALRDGMQDTPAAGALAVQELVPQEQACEHPDLACHGDACPLARAFYDRLPAARQEAFDTGWLDAAAQRRIALQHGICPYYLGQELMRWSDVLVGDVHHGFDPRGQVWGLQQALDWKLAVLVDEAHNLVERARRMYSADLPLAALRSAIRGAPAGVRGPLQALAQALRETVTDALAREASADEDSSSGPPPSADIAPAPAAYAVLATAPDAFVQALQNAGGALSEHFQQHPLAVGPLLNFHFDLQRFQRLVDTLGEHSLLEVQRQDGAGRGAGSDADGSVGDAAEDADLDEEVEGLIDPVEPIDPIELSAATTAPVARRARPALALALPDDGGGLTIGVRNLVPAPFLRPRWVALHGSTLFSATLAPPEHAVRLLGLPEDTAWIDVPPAFPPEHLQVRVAAHLSTRWAHRARSLPRLVQVIETQFDAHPGNYLAFFSSFDYLDRAAALLAQRRPDLPQWRQDRRMSASARQAFLARFRPQGRGIGFAVLGGVFAEGVDLPGSMLIGAFVATLGLPPVSPAQAQTRERLQALFGADLGDADLIPAMQRVVQAAGRVLRTPEDRGWLWLLDDRYRREDVVALLPAWWGLRDAPDDRSGDRFDGQPGG